MLPSFRNDTHENLRIGRHRPSGGVRTVRTIDVLEMSIFNNSARPLWPISSYWHLWLQNYLNRVHKVKIRMKKRNRRENPGSMIQSAPTEQWYLDILQWKGSLCSLSYDKRNESKWNYLVQYSNRHMHNCGFNSKQRVHIFLGATPDGKQMHSCLIKINGLWITTFFLRKK